MAAKGPVFTVKSNSVEKAVIKNTRKMTSGNYLQWNIWVQFKLWHFISPRHEFLGVWVNIIIKNSPLGRKFDGFKFIHPPFAELHTIIDKLRERKGIFNLILT